MKVNNKKKNWLFIALLSAFFTIGVLNSSVRVSPDGSTVEITACGKTIYTVGICYFLEEDGDTEAAGDEWEKWYDEIVAYLCSI